MCHLRDVVPGDIVIADFHLVVPGLHRYCGGQPRDPDVLSGQLRPLLVNHQRRIFRGWAGPGNFCLQRTGSDSDRRPRSSPQRVGRIQETDNHSFTLGNIFKTSPWLFCRHVTCAVLVAKSTDVPSLVSEIMMSSMRFYQKKWLLLLHPQNERNSKNIDLARFGIEDIAIKSKLSSTKLSIHNGTVTMLFTCRKRTLCGNFLGCARV